MASGQQHPPRDEDTLSVPPGVPRLVTREDHLLPLLLHPVGDPGSSTGGGPNAPGTEGTSSGVDSAGERRIAQVLVDVPLPHLDRPFDYLVPEELDAAVRPGVRVKVRFAGQDTDGFVVGRSTTSAFGGRLTPIRRLVSPEPVLGERLLEVAQRVASRYGGTVGDVLRLAVPPRHAAAEKALDKAMDAASAGVAGAVDDETSGPDTNGEPATIAEGTEPEQAGPPIPDAWAAYVAGGAFLRRVAAGEGPAAAWTALPAQPRDTDWPRALAQAAESTLAAGRGVLIVVPDHRDVDRVDAELTTVLGAGRHVRLTAAQGPQARYTAWLKVRRGLVRCVVGTRAAAFAPVRDLGLVAWWDDGDDLFAEPRAPYPHVREVLLAQARTAGAAALTGGFARSVAVQRLVEGGDFKELQADRAVVRTSAPVVRVAGERDADLARDPAARRAHLPRVAWEAAQSALADGPVLVHVPRRGYLPALTCRTCRHRAACPTCQGPLQLPGRSAGPICGWCGRAPQGYHCRECGDDRFRAAVVGARRTAEELGAAFPGVPVITSTGEQVHAGVTSAPALVLATPGAEPVADGGYGAVLLLDAWASLDRPSLEAGSETVRRWLGAAALARPGAPVVLGGVPDHATLREVEAVVRWAPQWYASTELAERAQLRLPPMSWLARLSGGRTDVRAAVATLRERGLPADAEIIDVMGPDDEHATTLVRVPAEEADQLSAAVHDVRATLSAKKEAGTVQLRTGLLDID